MNSKNKIFRILKEYPLAVLCSVVILIGVLVILLRGDASLDLSTREAELTNRIRTIEQNVKNSKNIKLEVVEIEDLVRRADAKLFNRDQRAVNINFFYALEDRLDVRISNISQMPTGDPIYATGGPRALKLHSTIAYNISLNAPFKEILAFLYELYRVEPFIRVADFQLSEANSQAGRQDMLEARLKVIVLAENN